MRFLFIILIITLLFGFSNKPYEAQVSNLHKFPFVGDEIFRRDASSATGWEWKNASEVWADMVLYNDPVLADGIGNITTGSVTIEGQYFTNSGATNGGAALRINADNVIIRRCLVNKSNDSGIVIDNQNDVTVELTLVTNCRRLIQVQGDGSNNNIKILNNNFSNAQWDRVTYGCCLGQYVTLDNVVGTGNEISDNIGDSYFGETYSEDLITTYNSGGTSGDRLDINNNKLRGGGASTSGGGILLGDNGSEYITADGNFLMNVGWYGMQVFSGTFLTMTNNKLYSQEYPWSGVGYFIKNATGTCNNISLGSTNEVYWRRSAQIYSSSGNYDYDYEVSPGCGANPGAPTSVASATILASMGMSGHILNHISEDGLKYLRSLDWRYEEVVQSIATYTLSGYDSRADGRRPTANAGPDQPTVTTTTASLSAAASDNDDTDHGNAFLTGKTNSLTGFLWVQVSGPNTATMSASTSSANNLSGMITGTYVFRLEVEQTNTEWGFETFDFDWVTITVSVGGGGGPVKKKGSGFF